MIDQLPNDSYSRPKPREGPAMAGVGKQKEKAKGMLMLTRVRFTYLEALDLDTGIGPYSPSAFPRSSSEEDSKANKKSKSE